MGTVIEAKRPSSKGFIVFAFLFLNVCYFLFKLTVISGFTLLDVIYAELFFISLFLLFSIVTKKRRWQESIARIALALVLMFAQQLVIIGVTVFGGTQLTTLAKVDTAKFKDEIETVNLNTLPIINDTLAEQMADKKLGDIPSLGSQYMLGHGVRQLVNDELTYVFPLEYRGFFKWFNSDGTPGYITVSAESGKVKLVTKIAGKELALKYVQSAYLFDQIERKAIVSQWTKQVGEAIFQINENGKPFWVVPLIDYRLLGAGEVNEKALIVDAQTGETKIYRFNKLPKWVDRAQHVALLQRNLDLYGHYVHGFWNFSDKDKKKLTDGYGVINVKGKVYFYTGVSSISADEALIGFMLTDGRTGDTAYMELSGAVETASQASAEGKVQQFGYSAAYPTLTSIDEKAVYFMPLMDKKGLIKKYSFVNVKDFNVVGIGDTVALAYQDYLAAYSSSNEGNDLSADDQLKSVSGTIERIGLLSVKNEDVLYVFTLAGDKNVYVLSTTVSQTAPLLQAGDTLAFKYNQLSAKNGRVIVQSIENWTK